MNDPLESELNDLEAELRRLRPAPLAPEWAERLAAAAQTIDRAGEANRWRLWAYCTGAGLAAGISLALLVADRGRARAPAAPSDFKPVSAEAVVTSARDDGYVVLGDGTPAHRIGESIVDTMTWSDPATHATVSWSVPREEVRLVPVSYH